MADEERLGWIGTGRMGSAMVRRLLAAGYRVVAWNRSPGKLQQLERDGAQRASTLADLGSCRVVFVSVTGSDQLLEVLSGESGLLGQELATEVVVDCSTVSPAASARARAMAAHRGVDFLAAPVSGSPVVAEAGRLGMVVSGPRRSFELVEPYCRVLAKSVHYLGEGEGARVVKLCHNLLLGTLSSSLAEVVVLSEKYGVRRSDLLRFLAESVLGSEFLRYKTPALVNLDFTPMFTTALLSKDYDLGLEAARAVDACMPLSALVREQLQAAIGNGYADADFACLLELRARDSGVKLVPETDSVV
jgi:3-hydroxyisobutyrate dehydrogenase